jgi:hypothetical protein
MKKILKQILLFFYAIPKSIRMTRAGNAGKLNCFEFHIWRIWRLEVKDRI